MAQDKNNEQKWEETLASEEGQKLLDEMAEEALKNVEAGNFKKMDKE